MPGRRKFNTAERLASFRYAGRGLGLVLREQHNAWVHAAASLAAVVAGLALGISRLEWLALVLAATAVWMAEAFNTAIEAVCDLVSPDQHPLVARAKDVAAGGVLVSAIGAATVGVLVFAPPLLEWLG